ncbi:TrsE [Exiguobacterium antarcticum]|uniref:TrsE n=1 Tax=Exiguobacterium antarcticum TaxID=132920 RepID=A0ABT6R5F1_9BACL|nr:TrsE [Exiguobacterium antarcticum]MDI3236184.1 TrsE [Exiguobacterium antarcticum]
MKFLEKLLGGKQQKEQEAFADTIHEYDGNLLSAISPDYISEAQNYVQLGSNFTRTLLCMDFNVMLSQENIQEWSELSDNISFSYHFEKASSGEVRGDMAKAIKQNRLKQIDTKLDDASKIEAQKQSEDAAQVIRELASGSEVMFHMNVLVQVNAPSLKELDRLTQKVRSILGSTTTAYLPNDRALDAFHSFLPLGENKVRELTSRLANSEAISFFFPFHENEMFQETGMYFGLNKKTKNVVLVDQEQLLNKHKFYIGVSGVGKSTALFADLMKEYMMGTRIQVNDPKGEFGSVFKVLGGEWIRFTAQGEGSILNPFDLPKHSYGDIINQEDDANLGFEQPERSAFNPIYDKIPQILVMFKLMYPDLDSTQSNILSGLIQQLYAEKNIDENTRFNSLQAEDFPTFTDFDNLLNKYKEESPTDYEYLNKFHKTIDVYINGIFKGVFNGITNVNVNSPLVAYDSLAFQNNEEVQRILYYNIMSYITYQAINGDKSPMRVVFDETHVIADPKIPIAMQQLYFMMKVLRSFNVGVSCATQSIKDFFSAKDDKRNYGEAVVNQAVQRMYLPMMEVEVAFLEKELSHRFSVKEKGILTVREGDKGSQAGKGILFIGSKKIYTQVKLTAMEEALWFDKKTLDQIVV